MIATAPLPTMRFNHSPRRLACSTVAAILALFLWRPLCAAETRALRAGAATSNITPALDVLMDGAIMQVGPAKHVRDELHARCLVLDDGAERIAIVVCDSTMIAGFVMDEAREIIRRQSGMPPNRVLISATHTHSTPRAIRISERAEDLAYLHFLARRIADGVQRALNNLAPAKIGWGRGAKPEFVHNRRWFVDPSVRRENPFGDPGDLVVMNPNRKAGGLLRPAGPVDPEIVVLSVQHADGRPLALLANYGLHYIGGIPQGVVSADYFGVFAERIKERMQPAQSNLPPFVGIMSNGTSGDVNAIDFAGPEEKHAAYEKMTQVAQSVADEVMRVYRGIEHRSDVSLAMKQVELPLRIRKPDAKRLAWAKPLYASGQAKFAAGRPLTRPEVYARETMHLKDYPDVAQVRIQAIRIGDLGITAAPSEVFAETGLAIKAQSPFKATFTITLANDYFGYLPTPQQHEWGGYETWPARSSCLEVGAEPKIREAALGLLRDLASTPSSGTIQLPANGRE